jgi:transcriptional regulator with XRE-family HTH domain
MNIGKAIVLLRKEKKISQEGLATESKLSRHYMYKLENNKASPTINTLVKISEVLSIPVSELIALAEKEN